MKRRELLRNIGLAAGTIAVSGGNVSAVLAAEKKIKKQRIIRIAHITDIHIRPEYDAPNRFRKCMDEIKKHKVDFFLNGGTLLVGLRIR